ncbi:MAG: hypothetical protein AAGI49_14685 [Bacteroidota bacterium]
MQQIIDQYLQKSQQYAQAATVLKEKYNRFSFIRLLLFIVAIALIVLIWSWSALAGIGSIVVFLIAFYRFVLWHQAIKTKENHLQQLSLINVNEAKVMQHDYSMFEDGAEFLEVGHPYTLDLDIFGDHSFFQYVNRTTTSVGKSALAAFLSLSATPAQIQARQGAIQELSHLLAWRQDLQAYGDQTKDQAEHLDLLKFWLDTPNFMLDNALYRAALYIAPALTLLAIALAFFFPWFIAILPLLFNAYILRKSVQQVNETHRQTTHAGEALAHYATLIQHIENQNFESPLLQKLSQSFSEGQAHQQIKRLSYIIEQLNLRYNIFAFFLNLGALWDLHWVYRLEKWKLKNKALLPNWFDHLAQFEVLSSFGNVYHNNPDWIFPTFHEKAMISTRELGHPLLHVSKRVCNDFDSPTQGHIKLITGSNMAGKSTFLRSVGLNIALANIGAPVCAKALSLPKLQVYTSMRTQDALHESTSSFYAELKRLQFIIAAVEKGEKIYFLLDEILKGTNSRDRHTGSKALIRQLIEEQGGGIIATHDLELGQLEAQYGGAMENLRIEVEIQDGKLHFDYKLKKGVSESFNATILMQQMGIKVKENMASSK